MTPYALLRSERDSLFPRLAVDLLDPSRPHLLPGFVEVFCGDSRPGQVSPFVHVVHHCVAFHVVNPH